MHINKALDLVSKTELINLSDKWKRGRLLAEEIWGKKCIFQVNIGVWVLKTFVLKKLPLSVMEFFLI